MNKSMTCHNTSFSTSQSTALDEEVMRVLQYIFTMTAMQKKALKQAWSAQEELQEVRYSDLCRDEIYVHKLHNLFVHLMKDSGLRVSREMSFRMIRLLGINTRLQYKISWTQFKSKIDTLEHKVTSELNSNANMQGDTSELRPSNNIEMKAPEIQAVQKVNSPPPERREAIPDDESDAQTRNTSQSFDSEASQSVEDNACQSATTITSDIGTQRPGTETVILTLPRDPAEDANNAPIQKNMTTSKDLEDDSIMKIVEEQMHRPILVNPAMRLPARSAKRVKQNKSLFTLLAKPFSSSRHKSHL